MTNSAPSTQQDTAGHAPGRPGDWSAGLVIAVDGPAGSGKSSAARGVARALDLRYLDTGAMYRALTWWLLAQDTDTADPAAVLAEFRGAPIEIGTDPAYPRIAVAGLDIAGPIRTRQVSNAVSDIASLPPVRAHLIARQREIIADAMAAGLGIVAEGRDIGSVVAPDAEVKVFLTASEGIRAQRRSADLGADRAVSAELTQREQARRDQRDAPQMARAADAVEIDTTALSLDAVITQIIGLARSKRAVRCG
ncbi:MAG: (d)CMP kinase [Streptosporangiaceae bacterium]